MYDFAYFHVNLHCTKNHYFFFSSPLSLFFSLSPLSDAFLFFFFLVGSGKSAFLISPKDLSELNEKERVRLLELVRDGIMSADDAVSVARGHPTPSAVCIFERTK